MKVIGRLLPFLINLQQCSLYQGQQAVFIFLFFFPSSGGWGKNITVHVAQSVRGN